MALHAKNRAEQIVASCMFRMQITIDC